MNDTNLQSVEVKAFVPARDFELSKRFYEAIGFTALWSSSDLAHMRHGNSSFLLQKFYVAEHAGNFMISLQVKDVDAWWRHIAAALVPFGIKVEPPRDQPWGMRDFPLIDPTGVLWRVGEPIAERTP